MGEGNSVVPVAAAVVAVVPRQFSPCRNWGKMFVRDGGGGVIGLPEVLKTDLEDLEMGNFPGADKRETCLV